METKLKRAITLPMLALYGIGNILGAGIYVLVGKVAGASGYAAIFAFLLAAFVATFTGISYGRLSARFPKSAGEANYVLEAFRLQSLAALIGFAIILSGLVSSAAILHGFAAYLLTFIALPSTLSITLALTILTVIAVWGIKESIMVTAVMTLLEVFGLLFVIYYAWPDVTQFEVTLNHAIEDLHYFGFALFSGAFIAFYAYIGFEDMVNVAEEVKKPKTTMPRALLIAITVTSLMYIVVTFVAISQVSPDALSKSNAPLALIYESSVGEKPYLISLIALFAVINGALVNLIMSSRVIYGLASNGLFLRYFSHVNKRRQTPIRATVLIAVSVLTMSLLLPLLSLAKVTSFIILIVFIIVNASCFTIWYRDRGRWQNFLFIPMIGVITCLALLLVPMFTSG